MEELNQGWGSMVYVTTLPEINTPSVLTLNDCHDFAQVFIDTTYVGKIDRVRNEKSLLLPAVKKGQELKILIEAMGRINFGRAIKDYKGITESVTLSTDIDGHELIWNLKHWNIFTIPDSYAAAKKALDTAQRDSLTKMMFKGSGYYRGYFNLKKVGDTFLNMEAFGKGQVYVNGHAVGRFWSIGPQQTLFVPGCWLKKGKNEVIVLDVVGPSVKAYYFTKDKKRLSPWLFAQNHPELDLLNVEKSRTHNNPGDKPDLNSATPLSAGTLAAGNGWQMVRFDTPKTGRYLAIQALSTHDGKDVVSVAELYAINANGSRLSREQWTVKYADSEETKRGNNTAEKCFDLQESTYWRTEKGVALPHLVVIDLGSEQTITGIDYLPRMEEGAPGSIKDYKIFVY
jgi:beta-galactosidase